MAKRNAVTGPSKTAKIIKSPPHRLAVNALLNNITFLLHTTVTSDEYSRIGMLRFFQISKNMTFYVF